MNGNSPKPFMYGRQRKASPQPRRDWLSHSLPRNQIPYKQNNLLPQRLTDTGVSEGDSK